MVVCGGDGLLVEVLGPGVAAAGVAGEVADRVAELLVAGPAEPDGPDLAGLAGRGRDAGEAGQRIRGGGNGARQSPISASSRVAQTVPERGRLVKMCASTWAASCSSICSDRALIWSTRVRRTAVMVRVMCTVAVVPAAPRGAAISRACSTAGSVRPQ